MILIKPDSSGLVWAHRLIDFFVPILSIFVTSHIFLNIDWTLQYTFMGVLAGLLLLVSAQYSGVYSNWRGRSIFHSSRLLLNAWLLTWAGLIIFSFLTKDSEDFSRLALITWAITTPLVLLFYRALIRFVLLKQRISNNSLKKVVIAGAGKVGKHLHHTLNKNKWLGYEVLAYYDDNIDLHNTTINGAPVLGDLMQLKQDAKKHLFDEVYLCLPLRSEERLKLILNKLTNTTVAVKFIPDLFSFDLLHGKLTNFNGIPVMSVYDTPLNSSSNKFIKRLEDLVISTFILTLISPLMIILATGVKLTSPGPIFYRQVRVGWNGENFQMLKFRSMPIDVEKDGVKWGSASNKTNTWFGQFIRSTSLDELPQFINVLKGDMSIVGPRPERDIFVEKFREEIPRYMQKHMVKAGITGWAQINGLRGDTCLNTRVEYDLHYINDWSLWLDIKIIFLTLFKGFINKNAN